VRFIARDAIRRQLDNDNIVLLSNLGFTAAGEVLNCNTYDVGLHAAVELNADKLICLHLDDVKGGSGLRPRTCIAVALAAAVPGAGVALDPAGLDGSAPHVKPTAGTIWLEQCLWSCFAWLVRPHPVHLACLDLAVLCMACLSMACLSMACMIVPCCFPLV
jgi:hypothetical protein